MNKIICGDALTELRKLPDGIVQTCVTSPPYFGLRDYGVEGQIGLEETPELYIARLVEVFYEVKRVLRDDGTLWVNIGDSYANDEKWGGTTGGKHAQGLHGEPIGRRRQHTGLKPKDLIGIPWMLAFALRADGWYLRSDIIWAKSNCMPESVEDRPTKAHEYIFLLSKSERYFYDAQAIAEQSLYPVGSREDKPQGSFDGKYGDSAFRAIRNTRNKRSIWTVSTQSYDGAHFATFPPKLIEPCILAGTSPRACELCGAPWERVTEREQIAERGTRFIGSDIKGLQPNNTNRHYDSHGSSIASFTSYTTGWQPTCSHDNDGSGSCVVLDPFCGAGTVPLVSLKYHRQYIGIELNPDYVKLINKRIHTTQPVLWEVPA